MSNAICLSKGHIAKKTGRITAEDAEGERRERRYLGIEERSIAALASLALKTSGMMASCWRVQAQRTCSNNDANAAVGGPKRAILVNGGPGKERPA